MPDICCDFDKGRMNNSMVILSSGSQWGLLMLTSGAKGRTRRRATLVMGVRHKLARLVFPTLIGSPFGSNLPDVVRAVPYARLGAILLQ